MSFEVINEDAPQESVEKNEEVQRATLVFPLYTIILIASLIAVFLAQLFADGQSSIVEGGRNSVLLAGFVKQFFGEGQYWRILTGAALHGGIIHLGFNAYALYVLGKLIETLSNRAHLAVVFLLAAFGGGVLSLIFLPETWTVGASGGIVGFLGYLTVYGFKRRKLLPDGFLKNMLFNIGLMAFIGISLNFSESSFKIDNFGHLGGLLVGAIYGAIQIPANLYKDPRETNQAMKIVGVASLGIFITVAIFSILILLGIVEIPFPELYLR